MVHITELEVRDYECDIQGIVNNARYLHYLEHARHKVLEDLDIDFAAMHEQGLDLVVTEANIKYLSSLKPKDSFRVETELSSNGKLKLFFTQKILKKDQLILDSVITGVCLNRNTSKPVKISDFMSI